MAISSNTTGLRPGVCTSTTRPTAPYEGQMIYTTDLDTLEIWNGSVWKIIGQASTSSIANLDNGGMQKLESVSFSGTSFQFTDGIITNDFNVHKIVVRLSETQNSNALIRYTLRAAGSAITGTSLYRRVTQTTRTSSVTSSSFFENDYGEFMRVSDSGDRTTVCEMVLSDLAFARNKKGFSQNSVIDTNGEVIIYRHGLAAQSTTAVNGMSIASSTGTITGVATLYGYRN